MKKELILLSCICVLASPPVPADQDPTTDGVSNLTIPYHGILEINRDPYPESVGMTFSLYDAADDSLVYEETFDTVPVFNGRFSVELGSSNGDTSEQQLANVISMADDLYLQITLKLIDGDGNPQDVPLSNRQSLLPAPYAHWSRRATDLVASGEDYSGGTRAPLTVVSPCGSNTCNLRLDGNTVEAQNSSLFLNWSHKNGTSVGGNLNVLGTTTVGNLIADNANIGGGASAGGVTVYGSGSTVIGNNSKADSLAVRGADYSGTTAPLTVNDSLHMDSNTVEATNGSLYLNWHHENPVRVGGQLMVQESITSGGRIVLTPQSGAQLTSFTHDGETCVSVCSRLGPNWTCGHAWSTWEPGAGNCVDASSGRWLCFCEYP